MYLASGELKKNLKPREFRTWEGRPMKTKEILKRKILRESHLMSRLELYYVDSTNIFRTKSCRKHWCIYDSPRMYCSLPRIWILRIPHTIDYFQALERRQRYHCSTPVDAKRRHVGNLVRL